MATVVGTGASHKANTATALKDATRAARASLAGRTPTFGFVFVASTHDLKTALEAAMEASGCNDLIGCTTAGEITERGVTYGGSAVMLVATDDSTCRAVFTEGLVQDHRKSALELQRSMQEARAAAFAKDHRRLTSVVLTDGLAGKGENLVFDYYESLNATAQIVGGAAGDDGAFKETRVGLGAQVGTNAAVAMHVFSAKPWGIGVAHGLRSTTKPMRVTKASANVVYEVNNAPAFDIYRAHAKSRGIHLTPAGASGYMIANELGIHFFEKINRARAPLAVGSDGSLTCAAAIPEGAMISILDGEPDRMIEAAASAAEEAKQHLGDAKAAGVLLFDCVCRGMILKEAFAREIEAVRATFGDVPVAGFLTYGEIARYRGRLDGWHNATAVVAAIPA